MLEHTERVYHEYDGTRMYVIINFLVEGWMWHQMATYVRNVIGALGLSVELVIAKRLQTNRIPRSMNNENGISPISRNVRQQMNSNIRTREKEIHYVFELNRHSLIRLFLETHCSVKRAWNSTGSEGSECKWASTFYSVTKLFVE